MLAERANTIARVSIKQKTWYQCPCTKYDVAKCQKLVAAGEPALCEVEKLDGSDDSHLCVPGLTARRLKKFWTWIDKNGPGGCWVWRGCLPPSGVPRFMVNCNSLSAPQLVWVLEGYGPLSRGQALMRTCGTRGCVNPAHMVVVSKGTKRQGVPGQDQPSQDPRGQDSPQRTNLFERARELGFTFTRTGKNRYRVMKSWMK